MIELAWQQTQCHRGKGFDDVIDYALKHWDSLEAAAKAAQSHTDAVYSAENAAGIDFAITRATSKAFTRMIFRSTPRRS